MARREENANGDRNDEGGDKSPLAFRFGRFHRAKLFPSPSQGTRNGIVRGRNMFALCAEVAGGAANAVGGTSA